MRPIFSLPHSLSQLLIQVVEVVEFLKDPKTFSKLGARPPKGILFEGDPGTGKTLMAKALAGEAMVPFYQVCCAHLTITLKLPDHDFDCPDDGY